MLKRMGVMNKQMTVAVAVKCSQLETIPRFMWSINSIIAKSCLKRPLKAIIAKGAQQRY